MTTQDTKQQNPQDTTIIDELETIAEQVGDDTENL